MSLVKKILDGYIPSNILAMELNIDNKLFDNSILQSINFKNIKLIQIPLSAVKFMDSSDYVSAILNQNEKDESMYDYVLHISPTIRIGFWK